MQGRRLRGLLAAGGIVAASVGGSAQPDVTLRVRVDQVVVDVAVTDERGQVVSGLTRDDFEIEDDGRPQNITSFSSVSLAYDSLTIAASAQPPRPAPASDVRSNRDAAEARIYVLVLDDANVGATQTTEMKSAVRAFIDRYLGPRDLAAVVTTTGMGMNQEFTDDRARLRAAVDRFVGRSLRSNAVEQTELYVRQLERDPMRDRRARATGRTYGAAATEENAIDAEQSRDMLVSLDTLRNVAEGLASAQNRRKAVVFFSNGIAYSYTARNRDRASELRSTIDVATRANVAIYGVDVRGLHQKGGDTMDLRLLPPGDPAGVTAALKGERLREADSLMSLSEETGGVASLDTNNLDTAFTRIVARNSVYYVLGYSPAPAHDDGRFHTIRVNVKRAGLKVSARKGYTALKTEAPKRPTRAAPPTPARAAAAADAPAPVSPLIGAMLRSALPDASLLFDVHAVALTGAVDNVTLVIEAQGRDLTFVERDGISSDTLDAGVLALAPAGPAGDPVGVRAQLDLDRPARALAEQHGVRLTPTLSLPPGRYQVRVALHELGGAKGGSVLADVDVPALPKKGLLMTALAITSTSAKGAYTAQRDQTLARALGGPPTTRRTFSPAETLGFYAEISDAPSLRPHDIDVTTLVLDEAGAVRVRSVEARANRVPAAASGTFGYAASLPLRSLRPGRYQLRVEARSSAAGAAPVQREVSFVIAP